MLQLPMKNQNQNPTFKNVKDTVEFEKCDLILTLVCL